MIEVGVTVIEDDGGVMAASLTAAGLALAEAGIHLCDLVVGVKVGLSSDNRLLVDPSKEEEKQVKQGGGELILGYLANLEQVGQMTIVYICTVHRTGFAGGLPDVRGSDESGRHVQGPCVRHQYQQPRVTRSPGGARTQTQTEEKDREPKVTM